MDLWSRLPVVSEDWLRRIKYGMAAGLLITFSLTLYYFHEQSLAFIVHLGEWATDAGPAGMLVFIALDALFVTSMLPGMVFTMMAGTIWGIGGGFVAAVAGKWIGAVFAFLIGKFMCSCAGDYIRAVPKYSQYLEALEKADWKIPLYLRLSPLIPYNMLNYALAVTNITLLTYMWTSFVGMLPGTLALVYMGSVAGSIAKSVHNGDEEFTVENVVFAIISIALTLLFIWLTGKTIAHELNKKTRPAEVEELA